MLWTQKVFPEPKTSLKSYFTLAQFVDLDITASFGVFELSKDDGSFEWISFIECIEPPQRQVRIGGFI